MTRVLSTITKNGLSTFFQELANILLMLRLETYTFTRKKKREASIPDRGTGLSKGVVSGAVACLPNNP
jgi:hypothetical protein